MNPNGRPLLALVEFIDHGALKSAYERAGYRVAVEFTARKAIARARSLKPAVVVADFYHQPDFRDRVSNLESLLATLQGLAEPPRLLVLHEPSHQAALDKLRQRFRIDATLARPVNPQALESMLRDWTAG